MRVALYARVSTQRQAQSQTIEQQLDRLQAYVQEQGWQVSPNHIYRDEGYSGASLNRPGLDALRDRAALADLDVVIITAPDRLARRYLHQVVVIEELAEHGRRVAFVERPMSQDPNDQLLLQIRGAVAEYERTLITERLRRGRLARLRAGQLLPWIRPPFGYRVDPDRPRDPAGLQRDAFAAGVVERIFASYVEERTTLCGIAKRLTASGVPTPTGKMGWATSTLRNLLQNPTYTGTTYGNWRRVVPSRRRRSPLQPVGCGLTTLPRASDEWIPIAVPAIISQEVFDLAQEKLALNRKRASRHNTRHQYLLRSLVSCGLCRLAATGRTSWDGRSYYVCTGHARTPTSPHCSSRHTPTRQLDDLVWTDLYSVLTHPEQLNAALQRAQGGQWLPGELAARRAAVQQALAQTQRQQDRLLDAYLAGVIDLAAFECKRGELTRRLETLRAQQRQLDATAQQYLNLAAVAASLEAFCAQVSDGLVSATFEQKRALVELLIDRVIVTHDEVEIRYVVPTSHNHALVPFCQLRANYLLVVQTLPTGRHLGAAQRGPAPARAGPGRAAPAAERVHHRQPERQDLGHRRRARLRRGQEDHWPQTPHRGRHARPGAQGPSSIRPPSRNVPPSRCSWRGSPSSSRASSTSGWTRATRAAGGSGSRSTSAGASRSCSTRAPGSAASGASWTRSLASASSGSPSRASRASRACSRAGGSWNEHFLGSCTAAAWSATTSA
jgi:site-specific DNA recombinase